MTVEKSSLPPPPRPRGFAAMSPEKRRAIAAMGGASLAPEQRSFARNPDLARTAGQKGGLHRVGKLKD